MWLWGRPAGVCAGDEDDVVESSESTVARKEAITPWTEASEFPGERKKTAVTWSSPSGGAAGADGSSASMAEGYQVDDGRRLPQ